MTLTEGSSWRCRLGAQPRAGLTGCGSRSSLGGSNELSMWTWTGSVNDDLIGQAEKGIPGHDGKKLAMTRIGGDYKTKVLTALAGKSLVPDIVAINDDVATYFPNADQFHDLQRTRREGARGRLPGLEVEARASRRTSKMMAYPMDTGPTALFYRRDVFEKAGLPTRDRPTWRPPPRTGTPTSQLGKKLKQAVPGSAITDNITSIYSLRAWPSCRSAT